MKCAMINNTTNKVENVIMADPQTDPAPEGYLLVGLEDQSPISFQWVYDPVTKQFSEP